MSQTIAGETEMQVDGNPDSIKNCTWTGEEDERRFLVNRCKTVHSHNVVFLLCVCVCVGLAVGLDPQGYGNPDFCWLSVHDTLIWSFAGPIFVVVLVRTRVQIPGQPILFVSPE